jgi:O-antigen/teichoic acid export membrane protein
MENHMHSLQRDMIRYVPVKLVPALVGLASIVVLTRALSPDQYGIYSVVLTTVLLLVQLGGSWLYTAVLYVYPDYYPDRSAEFRRETVRIQALSAIPAAAIGYGAIYIMTRRHLLAMAGTTVLAGQMFQSLLLSFFQSTRKVTEQAVSIVIQCLSQFGFLCLAVFLADGREVAALLSISAGYGAGILALALRSGGERRSCSPDGTASGRDLFRKLFAYGAPMCVWFFATQFYAIGDRLILKYFRTAADVGQYASFKDLSVGCAGFLTMPLLLASHPIIMAMWKKGCAKEDIEKLIARNIALLSLFFTPLLVLVHLCGPELIGMALGKRYLVDKSVMMFVVLSVYIASLSMYVQKGMEVTGKTDVMAKVALMVALLSLFGNLIAIPMHGVLGASVVVVASQLLYLSITWVLTSDTLLVRPPVPLMVKLVLWAAAVEFLCLLSPYLPFSSWSESMSLYYRLAVLVIATFALYITAEEIRSLFDLFPAGWKQA